MAKEYSYGICPYYINDNQIFIILIQPKGHVKYSFAKGKIESNETKERCAVREMFEETGIVVEENNLENYFEQQNKRKDVGVFLVDLTKLNPDVKLNIGHAECFELKFLNINDEIPIYNNQSSILKQIRDFFNSRI